MIPGPRETPDVETSSAAYAARFEGEVGAWFLEVQERIVRELLADLPTGSRVLEVGGGHGQLVGPLTDAGHEVTVLGSETVCAERLRPELARCSACFAVGDLLNLPFPSKAFEAVLAFRLLPHLKRWRRLIGELCRVSRHAVVVDYPSRRSFNVAAGLLFGAKAKVEENTRPFTVFPPAAVADAFEIHGFAVARERPEFLMPMALYRAVGSRTFARGIEGAGRRLGFVRFLGSPVVVRADRCSQAH